MSPINKTYIRGPFKADFLGGIVWGSPDNFHFADVRGWGQLGYKGDGEKIQDANLQFMVDALNEKVARDASPKGSGTFVPEDAALARLKEVGDQLIEANKELEWLRYYMREVYHCLGPADDSINRDIRRSYVQKVGIDLLPEKLRIEHLEYEDNHKKEA